jgi:four helix bundle protein
MKDFRNSKTREAAQNLTVACYAATDGFPEEEKLGLAADIRQCALKIGTNIAKVLGGQSKADVRRFLQNAMGSAVRLDTYLLLSRDLGYMRPADYEYLQSQLARIKRRLVSLIGKIVLQRKRSR